MKEINKNNFKTYLVLFLLFVIVILVVYGILYAAKNYNRDEIMTLNNLDAKYTLSSDQLDKVAQPSPNLPLVYDELPKTNSSLEEISMKELKKIFQTNKKSLLLLVKDGCSYCEEIEPKLIEVLKNNNISAYKINISKLSADEIVESYKYIEFDGTPMLYVIDNGIATHTLFGTTDTDTLNAFVDYFYIRNN